MSTQYTPAEIVTLATGLISGATVAGVGVYPWRMVPFEDDELPAISIFCTASSLPKRGNEPNLLVKRTDTLEVQAHTMATTGPESVPQAHEIIEECLRRIITDMDVRKEFYPSDATSINLSPNKETNATRVIATLSMDMSQDYRFADVRTGDAWTTFRGTMDIDTTGDAPDVDTKVTLTGGTP